MAVDDLRDARTAVEEGLITLEDFESIKVAYIKAQQYKAGLDAGFIKPADYAEVKDRFLDDISRLSISPTPAAWSPTEAAMPNSGGSRFLPPIDY